MIQYDFIKTIEHTLGLIICQMYDEQNIKMCALI